MCCYQNDADNFNLHSPCISALGTCVGMIKLAA